LIPKGTYKGQVPIKDVSKKIPANMSKINPSVPVMVFVKYKVANTKARITRIVLSVEPIFSFI
jgi:hypothetical protein